MAQPETYFVGRGEYVPNNTFPALVYRDVLPKPYTRETAQALCESNHWEKRGEWGAIMTAHFHPNTHECYAILEGTSKLLLGGERGDADHGGVEVDVSAGDVVVVPAGVSHRSLTADEAYRYIGVYPDTSPKWRNNFCKGEEPMDKLEEEIKNVGIPDYDPIYGKSGPLPTLWRETS